MKKITLEDIDRAGIELYDMCDEEKTTAAINAFAAAKWDDKVYLDIASGGWGWSIYLMDGTWIGDCFTDEDYDKSSRRYKDAVAEVADTVADAAWLLCPDIEFAQWDDLEQFSDRGPSPWDIANSRSYKFTSGTGRMAGREFRKLVVQMFNDGFCLGELCNDPVKWTAYYDVSPEEAVRICIELLPKIEPHTVYFNCYEAQDISGLLVLNYYDPDDEGKPVEVLLADVLDDIDLTTGQYKSEWRRKNSIYWLKKVNGKYEVDSDVVLVTGKGEQE